MAISNPPLIEDEEEAIQSENFILNKLTPDNLRLLDESQGAARLAIANLSDNQSYRADRLAIANLAQDGNIDHEERELIIDETINIDSTEISAEISAADSDALHRVREETAIRSSDAANISDNHSIIEQNTAERDENRVISDNGDDLDYNTTTNNPESVSSQSENPIDAYNSANIIVQAANLRCSCENLNIYYN